jgi:hypothetical protein
MKTTKVFDFEGVTFNIDMYKGDRCDGFSKEIIIKEAEINDIEKFNDFCGKYEIYQNTENLIDFFENNFKNEIEELIYEETK